MKQRAHHRSITSNHLTCILRVQPIALSPSSIVVVETLPLPLLPLQLITLAQHSKIQQLHGQSINQRTNRRAPRHSPNQHSTYLKQQDLRARQSPANDSSATALSAPQTGPAEKGRVQIKVSPTTTVRVQTDRHCTATARLASLHAPLTRLPRPQRTQPTD